MTNDLNISREVLHTDPDDPCSPFYGQPLFWFAQVVTTTRETFPSFAKVLARCEHRHTTEKAAWACSHRLETQTRQDWK